MKIKNYWPEYADYLTEKQWAKAGYILKPDAVGVELWTNNYCQHCAWYFSPEEVVKVSESGTAGNRWTKFSPGKVSHHQKRSVHGWSGKQSSRD